MNHARLLIVVLTILSTAAQVSTSLAADVTVVASFPADKGPGYKAIPDTQGAAGPNHVVDFDALNVVVHDKKTGEILLKKTQQEFWASVEPVNTLGHHKPWDPRVLYDPHSKRWIGIMADDGLGYLAVSTSSDPTKPWKGVLLPMPEADLGFKAGVDKNGFYATYANPEGRDIHTIHDCITIPKEDIIAPGGPILTNLSTFQKLEHDSYPATDLNPNKAPGDPEVILNKEFGDDCTQLYMYKITWQGKKASISEKQTIPLNKKYRSSYTTVEAATAPQPAPGVTIRAPRRTISVFQQGDSVYQCNNAKRTDESNWGILWCQVRVSDGKLLQEGLVDDPKCDYLVPALAVDKDGNIGIGCTRTSATEFPSVYVMVHGAGDQPGTMRTPVLAVPGTTYYRPANPTQYGAQFGNYSQTTIDPSNPSVFWTCQQYSNSTTPDQWCTAWAAFQLTKEERPTSGKTASASPRESDQKQKSVGAAESETFTGIAARTGTYKRPLLLVEGKRYELKASDKAEALVAETLAKFSTGDTNLYAIVGTRGTVNGKDGILVDRIAPTAKPLPGTEAAASATNAAEGIPPASAKTTPTVTSSVVTVSNRRYTVYDYADPAAKKFCVVIPEGLKTVRGLLVECNYAGGDSRGDWTFCTYYREFMHLHDFGLVASAGDIPHIRAFQAFRNCLQRVSVASQHPELVNAPYVAVGISAGGGFASTLITRDPNRTIAAGIVEARYNFTAFLPPNPPPPRAVLKAALAIPSVLISGGKHNPPEVQTGVFKMVDEVFVPFRPKGAEYAWLVLPDYGHEYAENRQDLLIMPLMDLAVRTRYPQDGDPTKGPIKLLSIDPATGWIADNTTWKSGLTKIYPAKDFKGDLGHSSWLQNEDIAFIYRAYATHNNPLTITSPGVCGPGTPAVDPGSNVPITVDAGKFPNWKKLKFYDRAKKLGTVTAAPAQFTATNLTPGYHVFSVLGTDAEGTVRTSDPRMVVVCSPPADVPPTQQKLLPPLVDLGPGQTYNGQEGGLYPGGSNVRPTAHDDAGRKIARGIVPLDATGNPDSVNGKIVIMPVSVSNGYGAWHRGDESDTSTTFMTRAQANPAKNPKLLIAYGFEYQLPGGNGGTGDPGPDSIFYKSLDCALKDQGVTPRQVQIVWLSMPVSGKSWGTNLPPEDWSFPADAQQSKLAWKEIVHAIYTRYPNVKIIYSSTKGAMYMSATATKNPEFIGGPIEPFNHDAAWGVKWVIEDQINGAADLNYDPARGPVKAPWLSWGPYFWSHPDGTPRQYDGLVWSIADVAADGLHPSLGGLTKYANMLLHQMTTDPTATPWFLKPGAPSNQPPMIARVASVGANPMSGETTALSVLGADDGGESNLTYTWSCSGPAGVAFSSNGPNRAKNTTATFPSAGRYTFQVTIADAGGLTATNSIMVTVTRR